MKIAYITPGSGGSFYCQNFFRDVALLQAFQALGHDVVQVPLYLPTNVGGDQSITETPVFYGAINIYLKEKVSFYRQAPVWLERILDSQVLLNLAARFSGSTRTEGLEEMTLSMLQGEYGYSDIVSGVPVMIGANGGQKIIEMTLNDLQKTRFKKSVASVQDMVDALCGTGFFENCNKDEKDA